MKYVSVQYFLVLTFSETLRSIICRKLVCPCFVEFVNPTTTVSLGPLEPLLSIVSRTSESQTSAQVVVFSTLTRWATSKYNHLSMDVFVIYESSNTDISPS